jgi:hypothetical protein
MFTCGSHLTMTMTTMPNGQVPHTARGEVGGGLRDEVYLTKPVS